MNQTGGDLGGGLVPPLEAPLPVKMRETLDAAFAKALTGSKRVGYDPLLVSCPEAYAAQIAKYFETTTILHGHPETPIPVVGNFETLESTMGLATKINMLAVDEGKTPFLIVTLGEIREDRDMIKHKDMIINWQVNIFHLQTSFPKVYIDPGGAYSGNIIKGGYTRLYSTKPIKVDLL